MSNETLRLVGIAGFGEGEPLIEDVMKTASKYVNIEDYEIFTLLEALDNPEMVAKAVERSLLIPHSAGLLALSEELSLDAIVAFNAPEPVAKGQLFKSAAHKTANHVLRLMDPERRPATAKVLMNGAGELMKSPLKNYGVLDQISTFSGAQELSKYKNKHPGKAVRSVITQGDEFFPPSPSAIQLAENNGVEVIEMSGVHDELYIDSEVIKKGLEDIHIN